MQVSATAGGADAVSGVSTTSLIRKIARGRVLRTGEAQGAALERGGPGEHWAGQSGAPNSWQRVPFRHWLGSGTPRRVSPQLAQGTMCHAVMTRTRHQTVPPVIGTARRRVGRRTAGLSPTAAVSKRLRLASARSMRRDASSGFVSGLRGIARTNIALSAASMGIPSRLPCPNCIRSIICPNGLVAAGSLG